MNQLCSDKLEEISVSIQENKDDPDNKVTIEIILCDIIQPVVKHVLICDKNDDSKVYVFKSMHIETGRTLRLETRSDFDSQGFPHRAQVKQYDAADNVTVHQIYQVEKVQINKPIPEDVFQVPSDQKYRVITDG